MCFTFAQTIKITMQIPGPPPWISRVKSWGRLWEVRREGEALACSPDYNTLSSQQVQDDLSISKFWAVTQ